jgi:hypothetical protein
LSRKIGGESRPGSMESQRRHGSRAAQSNGKLLGPEALPGSQDDQIAIFWAQLRQCSTNRVAQRDRISNAVGEILIG